MAGASKAETKKQRFRRLAEQRTNKAIDMLRLIGNLSNRMNYDYSEEDVKQIFDALENELYAAKEKFGVESREDKKFVLK